MRTIIELNLRKRLFFFILFFTLTVAGDRVIGSILRQLYFKQKTGQSQSLNYVLFSAREDVVIFGNSRAQHHYVSNTICDSLELSCYNAGIDGGHSLLMPYEQLKIVLKRYIPKVVIIELNPANLYWHDKSMYDKLNVLLPYYKPCPEISRTVLLRSPLEKYKLLSSIYPFNSQVVNILRSNYGKIKISNDSLKGYIPIDGTMDPNTFHQNNSPSSTVLSNPNQDLIFALRGIIRMCKINGVRLIFCNSPSFVNKGESQVFHRTECPDFENEIQKNKIEFYDFTNDTTFHGKYQWFKDKGHLNHQGAMIFTSKFAKLIQNQR